MCDAWHRDGVIVAGVRRDERINGSCGLMEGGSATCSLPSGASCSWAERNLFGWWAEPFFMFWMPPRSFLPATPGMIWMSPARVMFLKHEVRPPELIIVIQLTASVLRSLCRAAAGCADVRHDNPGRGKQTTAIHNALLVFTGYKKEKPVLGIYISTHLQLTSILAVVLLMISHPNPMFSLTCNL